MLSGLAILRVILGLFVSTILDPTLTNILGITLVSFANSDAGVIAIHCFPRHRGGRKIALQFVLINNKS